MPEQPPDESLSRESRAQVLPYVLAWEVEFTGMLYVTAWITPVFWSFDIAINFFTGIYKDGEVSLNLEDIAR